MSSAFLKVRFILSFSGACIAFGVTAQSNVPVVKTGKGYVKGMIENDIAVFKGVPYAAPPAGNLRFKPPVEHTAWNDTLSTTNFGAISMQPSGGKVSGAEDCLSLNIYTPKTDHNKRAVLVWVHGGSMTNGAGKFNDGHAFADHDDIVTITINYRLGAFGFLYLGDVDKSYAASGNNGLLDCIMALKWIKENIRAFGGDPARITIMGESAGAKLISAVLVSPLSKGLFQQFIAESGSVQCIRDTITAKNERSRLLKQLGLGAGDAGKLLTLPADSITKAQGIVATGIGGNSCFGPVYDGSAITEDAYQYAAGKNLPALRALIGTNKYEAAAFIKQEIDFGQINTKVFKPLFEDNSPLVDAAYRRELKTNRPYGVAVNVLTQYMYQMHTYRFAKVLAQNGTPVWMFRFDYSNGKPYGASHGQELKYVWDEHNLSSSADSVQKQLALSMHGAWARFIKNGDPNIPLLPHWPQYTNARRQVMHFDTANAVTELENVYDDKQFPSAVFVLK